MSMPFVYYCKQDPWQDDLDGNHGLPVLLARRSDEPGSEAIWCAQRQVWKPLPDLLGRLLGGDWWDQMPPEQAERYFGAAAVAGSAISV
jgi:hypothetical protein